MRPTSTTTNWSSTRPNSSIPFSRPVTAQSRPRTAQSTRPGTAAQRPTTAASSHHDGTFVVAVLECRGIGREIGIAAMDKETGQLTDCQTYVKTLHHLHLHYPTTVLVPDTFLTNVDSSTTLSSARARQSTSSPPVLVQCIQEEFPGASIEPVLRKYWNEEYGLQFINQLCADNEDRAATLLAASSKYYALSAACALFKYAEMRLNTRYSAHSLRIRYTPVEGTMLIDNDSAKNLELAGNMLSRKSPHSLFGILNHTWTAMGSRLLRVNLLAPITAHDAIEARLDAVEELVQTEDKFSAIKDALRTVNKLDLDKLISSLAASEARTSNGSKAASSRVSQMLQLRSVIRNIPVVRDAVKGCRSRLLEIVCDMLSDERIEHIESLITRSLNDDAMLYKGAGLTAVNARVYALKANQNCLLDVARETYKENISDIFQLNRDLSEQHGLPLQLIHQEHGFAFTLKNSELEEAGLTELPKCFINATARKGKWFFESMDLKKRNARMKDALDETLLLTDKTIKEIVAEVMVDAGALYKSSEAAKIALLDMLWSFVHASILRPEFTGTLAIKAGRHPTLEKVQSAGALVANDVYCCEASSFQLIQGPNMSGKSTYLRQVALLTVMAMCGCFVPAEYASFKIHDCLLTRLSNDDDIERNLSTFAEEMSSSAMILGLASGDSLIIVDELGRGTSPREGVGIAHAIAERLCKSKAYVFFATHFSELAVTLSRQPSVVNLHLSVQKSRPSSSSMGLSFRYKVVDGAPDNIEHYGLELARLADLPEDVLTEARRVSSRLSEMETNNKQQCEGNQVAIRRKAMLRLRTQLTQALHHSALPELELVEHLARLQREVASVLRGTLSFDETASSSASPGKE
ncbi:uncharacterized protein FOMMEDRAFT_83663 [Fomitiporia mediterranea MF3/22]|uniref:uncharacterized protein n=1 Tax=Fomitiporia mediterranea (strain MF3/22) TaxID=694068 RepID=UPI0004408745|nr:uncharacterized protein FOMMEDRAFT_83663 [Fomitiporia mediterranea MF3/22]EJD04505.1 hypothetical protein FOMMEDRAFT_83663 [Fomitiporia mediterranea MF3/22]